jgi:hypothetical protein
MKHQAIRRAALMLSVLLAAVVPTQAGTITLADVAQILVNGQTGRPARDFRVRSITLNGSVPVSGLTTSSAQSGNQTSSPNGSTNGTSTGAGDGSASLIDTAQTQQPGGTVETIDLGDVTGTVCDCGEIPVIDLPGGGFPKWPLLALAGLPLFFIPGGDDDVTTPGPTPPGPPPPPPPPIPEPATILLFGSGLMALGAGARRRRARKMLDGAAAEAEEV